MLSKFYEIIYETIQLMYVFFWCKDWLTNLSADLDALNAGARQRRQELAEEMRDAEKVITKTSEMEAKQVAKQYVKDLLSKVVG